MSRRGRLFTLVRHEVEALSDLAEDDLLVAEDSRQQDGEPST